MVATCFRKPICANLSLAAVHRPPPPHSPAQVVQCTSPRAYRSFSLVHLFVFGSLIFVIFGYRKEKRRPFRRTRAIVHSCRALYFIATPAPQLGSRTQREHLETATGTSPANAFLLAISSSLYFLPFFPLGWCTRLFGFSERCAALALLLCYFAKRAPAC